jgi:hypothetical protein
MELIRIGDDYYDPETGEYAGPADFHGYPGTIESEEDFLWVSRKIMESESALVAEQARLKAVIQNIEDMLRARQSRVNWLKSKYDSQLQDYAWMQLPRDSEGKPKVKTLRNPFLKISFRTTKGKLKVVDNESAVAFLEERNVFEAVKVEKRVLVSAIPRELAEEIVETVDALWPEGKPKPFEYIEGKEVATIQTGITSHEPTE